MGDQNIVSERNLHIRSRIDNSPEVDLITDQININNRIRQH
jgi:hypothetical protein